MIVLYPNEILRKKSLPIKPEEIFSPEIKKLIENMRYWIKRDGVGLAAVQIGVLKRIILVEIGGKPKVFINPKIIRKSFKKISIEEGCLSVPGQKGYVKRSQKISVKALDKTGKQIKFTAENLEAIIFQHEIDHLNGVLFIDKVVNK